MILGDDDDILRDPESGGGIDQVPIAGGILYGDAGPAWDVLVGGVPGEVLTVGAGGLPEWAVNPAGLWVDNDPYLTPFSTGRGIELENVAGLVSAYIRRGDNLLVIDADTGAVFIDGDNGVSLNYAGDTFLNVDNDGTDFIGAYRNLRIRGMPLIQGIISFYNIPNTEEAYAYRDNDYFYYDSGAGGEFAFQRNGTSYIYSANGLVNIANASLKLIDSETYPFTIENDAGTETSTIWRDDNYMQFDAGAGAASGMYFDAIANFVIKLGDNAGVTKVSILDSDGVEQLYFTSDGEIVGPLDDVIFLANHDVIAITGDAAGTYKFIVQSSTPADVFDVDSTGEVHVLAGSEIQWNNAGGLEYGEIHRDNDYFYYDCGSGADFAIQRIGVSYIVSGANLVQIQNASLKIIDSETYPLTIENDAGSETATIERDNAYMVFDAGAGATSGMYFDAIANFVIKLGDAAGVNKFSIIDSGDAEVLWIDSNGVIYGVGNDVELYAAATGDIIAKPGDDIGANFLYLINHSEAIVGGWNTLGSIGLGWDVSVTFPGPADRVILDVLNNRGDTATGGRLEQGADEFHDGFHARMFKDQWVDRVVTGSYGTAHTDANGWIRFTTGAAPTNEQAKDFNDIFEYFNSMRPTLQVEILLPQVDNDTNVFIGLVDTNVAAAYDGTVGSLVGFLMSHSINGDTNWYLQCSDDNTGSKDGGAASNTNRIVLRFEFIADDEVEWFIDGASQGTIDTNVPAADALQPVISIITDNGAKDLDIGDFDLWQDLT